jgi:hypothetical protein
MRVGKRSNRDDRDGPHFQHWPGPCVGLTKHLGDDIRGTGFITIVGAALGNEDKNAVRLDIGEF